MKPLSLPLLQVLSIGHWYIVEAGKSWVMFDKGVK